MKPRRPTTDRRVPRPHRPRRGDGSGGLPHAIRIIHEDADVIVVDKPPGLLTSNMPGERRESVFDALKDLARERGGRLARVFIIHRLDKEASGLLVFAKTEKAFHWLKEDFRSRRVHRLYLAVVEGEVPGGGEGDGVGGGALASGTIQSYMIDEDDEGLARSVPIGDVAKEGKRMRAARSAYPRSRPPAQVRPAGLTSRGPSRSGTQPPLRDEPRLAVTHYRVLAVGRGRTLIQLRLETGRKNQIRVHMKEWGHPIVGDQRYGAATDPIRRLALHAAELGFTNPATGMTARYHAPPPASFYDAVGMRPPTTVPSSPSGDHPTTPIAPPSPSHRLAVSPSEGSPETSWDNVAGWYDDLIGERRSDLYEQVIVPGALRLLEPKPGMRVLDAACGQGDLCRRLAVLGIEAVGVDASARLIEAARSRSEPETAHPIRYEVGDARALDDPALGLEPAAFDAATCVMALMNINPLDPVCRAVASLLKPGGSFIGVILHPAFRAPGQTSWGWDGGSKVEVKRPAAAGRLRDEETRRPTRGPRAASGASGPARQYRRVDGYLSPGQTPIVMNPGKAAHGGEAVTTITFHRPIQAYMKVLADAGLFIAAMEEWPSPRVSQPGPRAAEENRARREIPMFLAFRAVRVADRPVTGTQ